MIIKNKKFYSYLFYYLKYFKQNKFILIFLYLKKTVMIKYVNIK